MSFLVWRVRTVLLLFFLFCPFEIVTIVTKEHFLKSSKNVYYYAKKI